MDASQPLISAVGLSRLDDMHKRKIDMSDEIFVINVGGYVGESTHSEIEYAYSTGEKVRNLEETT